MSRIAGCAANTASRVPCATTRPSSTSTTCVARRNATRRFETANTAGPPGAHCLAATVADGWYAGYVGYGLLAGYGPHKTGRNIYGKTPAILCQLDIE